MAALGSTASRIFGTWLCGLPAAEQGLHRQECLCYRNHHGVRGVIRMRKIIAGLTVLIVCAPLGWAASGRGTQPFGGLTALSKAEGQRAPASAVAQLRHDYYLRDTSRVVDDAKPLLKKYPNDLELHAWYVIAKGYGDELTGIVDQMKKAGPNSPWTLLASAATATGGSPSETFQTKLDDCEKAIAGAKNDSDVLILATRIVQQAALMQSFSQKPPNADALKAYLKKYKGELRRTPEGLAAEAGALDTVAQIEKNTKSTAALKLADRVLKRNPTNVAALLLKSRILVKRQEYQVNYDLLKPAAHAVPDSYALHEAYWTAVLELPNGKPTDEKQEILADASRILSAVKPTAAMVEESLSQMHIASPDLGTALGDLCIKQYPSTAVEDAVWLGRAMIINPVTADERDLQAAALETFLDRPQHHDKDLVKEANSMLVYDLAEAKNPDVNRLYSAEMATATGPHASPSTEGIVTLADHKAHLPEIEALARKQLDSQWTALQKSLKNAQESQIKSQVNMFLQYTASSWLDAAGWVEFEAGKLDAALPDLEEATKLSPKDPQMAIHVGSVYEAKGENAKAEKTFLNAFAMPYYGDGDHPAIAALRELYIHTHGGDKGLEAYMQPILAKDAARRHKGILAERLKPAKPFKSFELASLNGPEVGSAGLRGKYLILNFWATW